jgi:ubiquinone biosynthesis protein
MDENNFFVVLHDQVSSGSFAQSRKTIEDELKMPIEQIFREVEEIPIGAGCIAQVYLATLLDGRKVVVKVRRPGVVECVQRDCAIMCSVASVLSFIPLIHFSNLHGTIQVFMESMRQQMVYKYSNIYLYFMNLSLL